MFSKVFVDCVWQSKHSEMWGIRVLTTWRSLERLGRDAWERGAERGTKGGQGPQLTNIWSRTCLWEPEDLLDKPSALFIYSFRFWP